MATLERISKEKIERARQLLLALIYTEKTDERHVKRDAIKQLLAPLIAARESGLSFDEISKVFSEAGLALTPKTLERYYYSLKTEEELAKEARLHAEKVTKLRQTLEAKALRAHQEHGAKVALQFTEAVQAKPRLYNALGEAGPASPAQSLAADAAREPTPRPSTAARPASPAEGQPQSPADAEKKAARSPAATAPAPNTSSGPSLNGRDENMAQQTSVASMEGATDQGGPKTAFTIDEIEHRSLQTEERTTISADVEVRQERVYYAHGEPFIGTLTKKQIHLLRTVGRIIALSSGKSSKDFVAMPSKI